MQFTNLTRALEIGANSYLVETDALRIVLDAGLHPKLEGREALPDFSLLGTQPVNAALVTHAHQDHVGSLPALLRGREDCRVFLSEPTRQIAEAMLHNSVSVMKRQRADSSPEDLPLYSHREVVDTIKSSQSVPLRVRTSFEGERLPISGSPECPFFEFYHAGHILGSVGVMIQVDGHRLFYTGDVNFDDQTLSQGASFPEGGVDTLVMECTRGDSPTPAGFTREAEEERFIKALASSFDRGGCTLIPVFALGKTQEVMAIIHKARKNKSLPNRPLYIGGLSTKITTITDKCSNHWPRQLPGLELADATSAITLRGRELERAPIDKPRVYALSSGMMTEMTLSNAFAQRILSNPRCSLFFVGYTDPESPAGRLRAAGQGGRVALEDGQPEQEILCQIEEFNLSAHANRESLLAFAEKLSPRNIVLVHGDQPATAWFQQALSTRLPASRIIVPKPGEPVSL